MRNPCPRAEPEAIDLLLEVDRIADIEQHVDEKNAARTCLYLLSCSAYLAEPDDATVLRTAYSVYLKVGAPAPGKPISAIQQVPGCSQATRPYLGQPPCAWPG